VNKPKYHLSPTGDFVIENYNSAASFASFFPGIAGIFGCPMWTFYANRGQCITSAGIFDKNSPIMEFQPANKAYRLTSLQGFRTFLKVNGRYYEPFRENSPHRQEMHIATHSLRIVETNTELKLRVEVTFFTIPNEQFPALARIMKVVNLSKKNQKIEALDGLPIIIPYGFNNDLLKQISQTIEAWSAVENLEHQAPFYKLKVIPADMAELRPLAKGNFFISFCQQKSPVSYVINPHVIFGELSSLELPINFVEKSNFRVPAAQTTEGFIPSAFAHKIFTLPPRREFEICSLFGEIDSAALLNQARPRITDRRYLAQKFEENKKLIEDICGAMRTGSAARSFDLYAQYTFLDNVMRGGLPVNFGGKNTYLYYRKHGDMERDYNDFKLMPTYFSQGNGNYRDINQNRRNDLFFFPFIAEDNILRFFNLVQLDGYNPLVVLGSRYFISSPELAVRIIKKHLQDPPQQVFDSAVNPFLLGSLLKDLQTSGQVFKTSLQEFAADLLAHATAEETAVHGEGFWTDHFSYNTDLLESFECVYPDRLADLFCAAKVATFFDNDHVVLPRRDKYRLTENGVRQYRSVRPDPAKAALIDKREHDKNVVRSGNGQGEVYRTTLLVKVLAIVANKAASFDAEGTGLEMEADKPDWYDALNGLPGLFGSSLSETFELKRLCLFALKHLPAQLSLGLPVELKDLIDALSKLFAAGTDNFHYWDAATTLKEEYRERTRLGISGQEVVVDGNFAAAFLRQVVAKCDHGITKVKDHYGPYRTYFINEVVEHELFDRDKVRVKRFKQQPLPLFLEGFVHALKVEGDKSIYGQVKKSALYDKGLKMYKVNAPLRGTPIEIGRARIFTPGWLENESIWLHMEYKYMLELLKAGQYQEFFADFKNVLVPFMDPQKYKRSILENSSFIVSSAHSNKENHGRGFVARLSGGAAEFIEMWLIMTTGKKLFALDDKGELLFRLAPVLPAWLFKRGKFSCQLLGGIALEYINKKGKATFGQGGVTPSSYKLYLPGKEVVIGGPIIKEPYARLIRNRKVNKIVVTLS
jgi:hypothetical protein